MNQNNELERAYDALRQADEAGNVDDAQQIADYIRTLEPQTKARKIPEKDLVSPELTAIGGSLSALVAGRAMEGFEQGRLREMARQARVHVPEEVIQQGRNAVINYIKAMHTGDISYVGGEDYKRAHALTEEAKIKDQMAPKGFRYDPFKQRYVSEQEFKTNTQKVEQERLAQQKAGAPTIEKLAGRSPATARTMAGVGGMLRKGVAPPFLERTAAGAYGGYSTADAINRAKQGDIPGAAISGTGALGSALTVSRNPRARAAGLGLMGLSYLGDRVYESQAESGPGLIESIAPYYEGAKAFFGYKAGGAIKGYSRGKKVGEAVKGGLDMVVGRGPNLTKKQFVPTESRAVKLSEGLSPFEGGKLRVTQADRMRVGEGMKGGSGFPGLQLTDPEHAARQAAWMVDAKGAGTALARSALEYPNTVFSNVLAKPTAHHSNRQVFGDMRDEYFKMLDRGEISPEWADSANKIIPRLTIGKEKKPMFSQPFDVRDKFAVQELVDTFDRRGALAEMFSGKGTGGKKGALPFYSRIIESYADPMTKDAQTFSVGNRLFTLTGEAPEYVTDLHPAYDWLLKGRDLGVHFDPVPQEIALPDFYNFMIKEKGKKPGTFHYTRGYPRAQDITEEYLTRLQKEGFADGGTV